MHIDTLIHENKEFIMLKTHIRDTDEHKYLKKLLLELNKKFNINQVDEFGNTLLHYACRERKYNVINCLLDNNADVSIPNYDGRLPIHIVAIYGATREIGCMMRNTSQVKEIIKSSHNTFNKLLSKFPESISIMDNHNNTPLNYFTIHSDISDIKILKNIGYMIKFSSKNNDYMIRTYLQLKKGKKN